jgi:hypothetical protein
MAIPGTTSQDQSSTLSSLSLGQPSTMPNGQHFILYSSEPWPILHRTFSGFALGLTYWEEGVSERPRPKAHNENN